jgi:UDP-glucose 4-epimerase
VTRVLVTGGAGFIGSNLVRALADRGDEVRVLDNFSTGHRANLDGLEERVRIFEGDVCDRAALLRAMEGVECVSHQAALPSVQRSIERPLETHRVNALGTLTVLDCAREIGVRRVVYASSSSVYGNTTALPKREDQLPAPASPYAASKLAGEHYARAFHEAYGIATVVLRYFNVFGPRQDPSSAYAAVIARFMRAAIRREQPTLFGSGEQSRDFTFVANVVDANLRALDASDAGGLVANIAMGEPLSLRALVGEIGSVADFALEPRVAPARTGEVLHSAADISLARERLGYTPRVNLREGLRRLFEWQRSLEGS